MSRATCRLASLVALIACLGVARLGGHDLPPDVLVQAYVKPEDTRLTVLLRVPLRAMGDIDYPTRGPGGLVDLGRVDRALHDAVALWILPGLRIFEDGHLLDAPVVSAVRVTLPDDRSFASYEEAAALVAGSPLDPATTVAWDQAWMDVALGYRIRSASASLVIEPRWARLGVRVVTALRFLPPGGGVRAFVLGGDPGRIALDPGALEAAWRFVRLGFAHILGGADHLLFLLCLVIPVRRIRTLVPVVTAFAVAHSITLIGSAVGLAPGALWFPPLVETLIALSIVYMALENILRDRFTHRWAVAFGFGLVHGFGFAFRLQETLQFAGTHLLTSLLSFNAGVEFGQLLVIAVVVPPVRWLIRAARTERVAVIVLSAIVAHTAWHWMVERGTTLGQYTVTWPRIDAAFAAGLSGWLLLAVVAAGAIWGLSILARTMAGPKGPALQPDAATPPLKPPRSAP